MTIYNKIVRPYFYINKKYALYIEMIRRFVNFCTKPSTNDYPKHIKVCFEKLKYYLNIQMAADLGYCETIKHLDELFKILS